MKLVKIFAVGLAIIGLAGALVWQVWLKDQVAYAKVATAYGAKMVCSCRFVAGREMESCKGDFTADVSAVTFSEDGETIRASVLGGVISAEADHEEGLGCVLVKPG
ncbi:hypothetical protein [Henriciella aquimarina]|uniref:hypothetical protein n=1 Tax=Henriciella aquimarina TaxID=545261 RepID=UPI0009FEEE59|nr:hypothetical protein [Henriciella aquimarina]